MSALEEVKVDAIQLKRLSTLSNTLSKANRLRLETVATYAAASEAARQSISMDGSGHALSRLSKTWAGYCLICMGGQASFATPWIDKVYTSVWAACFVLCGSLCAINLIYREVPYMHMPNDFLIAYVHIPAFQSFLFWRNFNRKQHTIDMMARCHELDFFASPKYATHRLAASWVVCTAMAGLSAIVLCAFALPATQVSAGLMSISNTTLHRYRMAGGGAFVSLHAYAMWFVVPPVICCLLAHFVMFILLCETHRQDFNAASQVLLAKLESTIAECPAAILATDPDNDMVVDADDPQFANKITEEAKASANATVQYEALLRTIVDSLGAAQQRLNISCNAWSGVSLHLVLFNALQVYISCFNLQAFLAGRLNGQPPTYYWILCLFFHVTSGFVLIIAFLGPACRLTVNVSGIVRSTTLKLEKAGASYMRVALVAGMLARRVGGFHMWGEPVGLGKCFPFLFSWMLLIFATFANILKDYALVQNSAGWPGSFPQPS